MFRNNALRRFLVMSFGIFIIGLGIALFKSSNLGTDPYTSGVMACGNLFKIEFAIIYWIANIVAFIIEFIWGRKMIGIGTIMNGTLVGVYIDLFLHLIKNSIGEPETLVMRFIFMVAGVIVLSFAASLYQTADLGISPYDSIAIIISNKFKINFFWARIITDSICVVISFVLGGITLGILGIGSFICALGMGPIVHFFNTKVSRKLCGYEN